MTVAAFVVSTALEPALLGQELAPSPPVTETPKPPTRRARRAPPADPFRFLDYRERSGGPGLQEIALRIEGDRIDMEVAHLGQTHREQGRVDPGLREILVRLLRDTEVWPLWEGAERGCIAFGDGPATREARLGHRHNTDPAFERFVAVVRQESWVLAYLGELRRYGTDEPSLAAGTINELLRDVRAGRLAPDERILDLLRSIMKDKTARPLVRRAADQALKAMGRSPSIETTEKPAPSPPREASEGDMAD